MLRKIKNILGKQGKKRTVKTNYMFFSVLISQAATLIAGQSYSNTTIYPFPYTGRFRCRIIGFQIKTTADPPGVPLSTTLGVVSRRMINPLSPYIFQAIIPGTNYFLSSNLDVGGFSKTGWWECDLSNGIDFALVSPEAKNLPILQVLLHFEVERVVEGSLLMKSS